MVGQPPPLKQVGAWNSGTSIAEVVNDNACLANMINSTLTNAVNSLELQMAPLITANTINASTVSAAPVPNANGIDVIAMYNTLQEVKRRVEAIERRLRDVPQTNHW
jgi:hypothetical protein